jgi:hypothetical protein
LPNPTLQTITALADALRVRVTIDASEVLRDVAGPERTADVPASPRS